MLHDTGGCSRDARLTWSGEQSVRMCSSGGMLGSEYWKKTRSLSNKYTN